MPYLFAHRKYPATPLYQPDDPILMELNDFWRPSCYQGAGIFSRQTGYYFGCVKINDWDQFLVYQNRIRKILAHRDESQHDPYGNFDDIQAWIWQIPVQYDNWVVPRFPIDSPNLAGIGVSAYGSREWIFRLETRWEPRDKPKKLFGREIHR